VHRVVVGLWFVYPFYAVSCALNLALKMRGPVVDVILRNVSFWLFVPAVMYILVEFALFVVLLNEVVPGSKKVEEKVEEEKEEEKMEEEKMVEESGGRKVPVFTDDPNGFSYLGMVP